MFIVGNYNIAVAFTEELESGTEGLIKALCDSPISKGSTIFFMPDVHPGKGCCIGTTMTITDKVAPGLVGVDIGCGVSAFKIKPKKGNIELSQLDKVVHSIPSIGTIRKDPHPFGEEFVLNDLYCLGSIRADKAMKSIGTLGGGNHFIELDKSDNGDYWLVIHTGSRILGAEIAKYYQDEAFKETTDNIPYEFAVASGALLDEYIHDTIIATNFASVNREAIADIICKKMKWKVEDTIESRHNYIDTKRNILRKGAISAEAGERMIIPLNMKDGCVIAEGKGNPFWNYSAPHGCGRKLSRKDAESQITITQFKKDMEGVYSTSVSKNTIDEAPMAYKDPKIILEAIEPTCEVKEVLHSIYNYKNGK